MSENVYEKKPHLIRLYKSNSNSMFLSFFSDFDWSVGKIKWFLHFNKKPVLMDI